MTGDDGVKSGPPAENAVERAVESISEGLPIPDDLSKSGNPQVDRVVENLRAIQRIHQVHADPGAHDAAPTPGAVAVPKPGPETEPALFTWGPLRVLELLGRGTSSEVYRAWDPRLQVEIALKLRSRGAFTSESRSFLDEARRMAQVQHSNLLRVRGADRHDGREGIWMDLVRGKTLKQYVAEHGVLSAREAAVMGMEVCSALAALHDAGLVHRDVKPSNVMRGLGGHIVLMDLGSASVHRHEGGSGDDLGGTPLTMAPEVILDGQAPGPAADLYGAGVLLYFLVTGRFPIEATSWGELIERHRQRAGAPLLNLRPDLPASFVSVVERALQPRPQERFATAGDLHRALAAAGGAAGVDRGPEPAPVPQDSRRMWLWGIVIVLALAGLTWAAVRYRGAAAFDPAIRLVRTSAAGPQPLTDGAVIRTGDQIHVELSVDSAAYAWVFAEDNGARPAVLFPDASSAGNPLPGTGLQRLPAAVNSGRADHWVVTPGAHAQLVVVLCARRGIAAADSLAAALRSLPQTAVLPADPTLHERGLAPAPRPQHLDSFVLDGFLRRFGPGTGVHTARFFLRYGQPGN